ncbi:MAG: flagellin N-terminal helical domain-containing protein [Armatimonadota bacterium]
MSLRINQNISALTAHRWLQTNDSSMAKSIERLSSGFRINSAADDAAGLVISETLRTQISGMGVAQRNTQDAINMIKTTEKALDEIETQLRNVRDLALHASSANGNAALIAADQAQVDKALQSIDRIAGQTEFAGQKLLSTGAGNSIEGKVFQIGAQSGQTATFNADGLGFGSVTMKTDMHAASLGFTGAAGAYASATSGSAFSAMAAAETEAFHVVWQRSNGDTEIVDFTVTAGGAGIADADEMVTAINAELTTAGYGDLLEAKNEAGSIAIAVVDRMENLAEQSTSSTLTVYSEPSNATGALFNFAGVSDSGTTATAGITLSTDPADYSALFTAIDSAMSQVEGLRVSLGAFQKNTLESNLNSLGVTKENLAASESAIRDTDMAAEMVSFTRAQILMQAGQSMMSQANQAPQSILQMLR